MPVGTTPRAARMLVEYWSGSAWTSLASSSGTSRVLTIEITDNLNAPRIAIVTLFNPRTSSSNIFETGDFDGDGILDRDEYNPNSTTGNPGDADGDGINDMRQALASTNATSDSGRSFDEFCWWFLLLLLLLLIPLLKRQYDNALI